MRPDSNSRRFSLVLLALLASAIPASAAQSPTPRQVAAPASDIVSGRVRLPDPAASAITSRAIVLPLAFERTGTGWRAELEIPVEKSGPLAIALLSPDAGTWRVSVRDGASASGFRPIDAAYAVERRTALADELAGWVVDRYDVADARAGSWTVRVETARESGARRPEPGFLLARPAGDVRVAMHVTTQRLVAGEPIGVAARVDSRETELDVARATLVLETTAGTRELAMLDDGLHEDGARGDGLFGALVPTDVRGDVRARVDVAGTTGDGMRFLRTAQTSFTVLDERVLLDGSVRTRLADDRRLELAIGAFPLGPKQRFHVSAEVWGTKPDGAMAPVCWLSRQVDPEERDGMWSLPLFLDARWLRVADVGLPLALVQVRVQDPDTEVVLDRAERLALAIDALPSIVLQNAGALEITSEMLTGSSTITVEGATSTSTFGELSSIVITPALMLVHGYCSGGSIWPAADFSQPKVEFLDANANRTHDQFALLIAQRAAQSSLTSFGVVAHSQGGCAALHLLTYYESGLDHATGARRIQSVATPYQGTPLASLGAFACGVNDDMTPAGSTTWLAGIPTWARAEVYFWTTANSGSACQFLTDFFLTNPEDGTVERFRGDLPGANSMGHTTGWCHTTGMTNPANYTDHTRNQAMNTAAAR